MHLVRRVLWGVTLAAGIAGCRHRGTEAPAPADRDAAVIVEVENHYYGDVVIYLARGGQRQRLGMVTALSTAEFKFPWRQLSLTGTSRLVASPIAGARSYSSDPLYVQPGQSISWTLESDLGRSSLSVF